ncbi:ABC transporter transmembrane domain-containing protein [Caulobacter sp. KR2-114]|uniref:ABC transporter transmembrane domain-containing protein n=1 Tax=Caulobacter sp. KR2-114 TaxID=3400912 RepID=UPI003BFB9812
MADDVARAEGRPGAGELLKADLAAAAAGREKRRDLKPLRYLAPFVRAHRGDAFLAGGFLLLSTSASLGLTWAGRLLADKGFASGNAHQLGLWFLIAGAVVLTLAGATAGRFYFISKLGERVVADIRVALYRHVMTLDQAAFLNIRVGEVLSRMTTDLTIVENMVGSSISVALRNFLTLIGALALLIVVSPAFTGFVVLLAALVIVPLFVTGRQVRRLSVNAQERFAGAVTYAGETLDALETIQAFGRQKRAGDRFAGAVEGAFQASLKRIGARAFMTALVMVLIAGGVGVVLWQASVAVFVHHTMSGGTLLQFVFLSVMAAGSVGALGETYGDLQKTAGAMDRIAELLSAEPAIAAPPAPTPLPSPARGALALRHVDFAYPGRPDLPALHGFDLTVQPGERVALVGPSGAGKSTVFRLLLRFYDPQAGQVMVDGVDLREADPDEVRARMALVAQDAALFSGSALENLRFGREEASVEELKAAARAAEAAAFLEALPEGYDTPLGERAKTLSGGQRQRLAIARALVRNAPILLLDEATSALDAENERLVQRALHDAMAGRTTLVIAHRLATVLEADRIVVMDQGRVVEEGKHSELIARGGLYARLARLQFGDQAA